MDVKHHNMNSTTNKHNDSFRGCLRVRADSDIAAQKEQTVSCLGLSSINANSLTGTPQKSPVGVPKNGLGALSPHETTSVLESQPGYNPQPGRSSTLSDVENRSKTYKVKELLDKMVIKREQIWNGIGKNKA